MPIALEGKRQWKWLHSSHNSMNKLQLHKLDHYLKYLFSSPTQSWPGYRTFIEARKCQEIYFLLSYFVKDFQQVSNQVILHQVNCSKSVSKILQAIISKSKPTSFCLLISREFINLSFKMLMLLFTLICLNPFLCLG